jgi:hypothetical protein
VALEEADESALWFEILTEGNIWKGADAVRLLDESEQLSAIFAKSRLTAVTNLKSDNQSTRIGTSDQRERTPRAKEI